jgi:hypothetical protein
MVVFGGRVQLMRVHSAKTANLVFSIGGGVWQSDGVFRVLASRTAFFDWLQIPPTRNYKFWCKSHNKISQTNVIYTSVQERNTGTKTICIAVLYLVVPYYTSKKKQTLQKKKHKICTTVIIICTAEYSRLRRAQPTAV